MTGGPAWLSQTSFDIDARMDNASYGPLERAVMMRLLLEERFRLRAHRDTRELPVYHLVFARADRKLGPQLRVLTSPCVPRINGVTGEETPCAVRTGPGNISGHGVAMAAIATYLSPVVGRIVVDRTGLTGRFDLALKFAVTPGVNPDLKATSFADTPSIFSAVQEQLGLRLESARSAVDVIVVDDIQRPTEN